MKSKLDNVIGIQGWTFAGKIFFRTAFVTIIGLSFFLICLHIYFDRNFTVLHSEQLQKIQGLFTGSISQDVLAGSYVEVRRKCELFASNEEIVAMVIRDHTDRIICDISKKFIGKKTHLESKIYFDESQVHPAAFIKIDYSLMNLMSILNNAFIMTLSAFFLVFVFLVFILQRLARNITKPIKVIAETMVGGNVDTLKSLRDRITDNQTREISFLLTGCEQFAEKISLYETQIVEETRNLATIRAAQMLAHDLRRPLTTARIGLQSIYEQLDPLTEASAKTQALIHAFSDSVTRVEQMLEEMLRCGRTNLNLESLDIHNLIESALKEVQKLEARKKYRINRRFKATQLIVGDKARISRLLSNLLENAIQAVDFDGVISISTIDCSDGLNMEIHNTGSFVPLEDRNHIFDLFYTRGKQNGTGLGLAIVRNIAEEHNGSIVCRSTLEAGTTFIVILKSPENKMRSKVDISETLAFCQEGDGPHTIVVDDNPFILDAWSAKLGMKRVLYFDRPSALEAHFSKYPNDAKSVQIVITDYVFDNEPEWNGRQLAEYMRHRTKAKIILASDYFLTGQDRSMFDAVIKKDPIDLVQLKKIKA